MSFMRNMESSDTLWCFNSAPVRYGSFHLPGVGLKHHTFCLPFTKTDFTKRIIRRTVPTVWNSLLRTIFKSP